MTYLQRECAYRRADSVGRLNVGRVLVLNNPPAWLDPKRTATKFMSSTPLNTGEIPENMPPAVAASPSALSFSTPAAAASASNPLTSDTSPVSHDAPPAMAAAVAASSSWGPARNHSEKGLIQDETRELAAASLLCMHKRQHTLG